MNCTKIVFSRPAPFARVAAVLCAWSTLAGATSTFAAPIDFTAELIGPGTNVQVSGNRVVWQNGSGAANTEVYMWENGTTTQITSNAVHDINPKVSSAGVLWERGTGTAAEMMFWDGTTTTQLTTNSVREQSASLSGNHAAWITGAGTGLDLVVWTVGGSPVNVTSGLPPANTADTVPHQSGTNTVWVRGSTPSQQIMKYDGTTVTQIHQGGQFAHADPTSHGSLVAWEQFPDPNTVIPTANGREIYYRDGAGPATRLTNNANPDFDPQVNNGNITWWGGIFNNNQVFLWDGDTVQQLSNSGLNQFPKIDGQFVVWQGWEGFGGGDLEIFLWDGSEVHQLTDNDVDDNMPQISGNHIVWQQGADVWHTTITVVPEPGSIVLAGLGLALVSAAAVRRKRAAGRKA